MEKQLSMDDQFLERIYHLIEENLSNENYSVEDLARMAGLSRSMLHRKLIRLTGKSASELITKKRLLRAKELLENNVATASEIAYKVGFNSPSYFTKVFKSYFHVLPGEVRKGIPVNTNHEVALQDLKNYSLNNHFKINKPYRIAFLILAIFIISGIVIFSYFIIERSSEMSIAVLPLNNLTGSADNDYFVDGMHDALIGELGQISSLRVISRTSTLRYRNTDMLLKDIAKELGVKSIVEGSVTGAGDSLRIIIQLIDVFPRERHLLANEYQEGMYKVLTVQSSAVADIAKKINLKLSKKEKQRLSEVRKVNPETYKSYLRGMYYLNQGTEQSFEKGINCLQEAIDRDPGDAFAYAGMAVGYAFVGHGQLNSEEAFLRATSCAKKAIKLDPTIDEAYTALSILYLYDVWDWTITKESFENALANNPSNEIAHAHYAWYHVLFNNMERAIYHAKQAAMIEPFSPAYASWLSLLYFHNNDYDNAEYWAKKALSLEENVPYGLVTLSWISLHKKQYQQAIEIIDKLPENDDYYKTLKAYVYVKAGKRDKALLYWSNMQEELKKGWVNTCYMGMTAACLGLTDSAFELLNDACDKKYYPITYIDFYPNTEDMRNDPRYNKLLLKMNLPTHKDLISSK